MLVECMKLCVVITDKDLALMNACEQVFPKANKDLFRFHIHQNINKKSKDKFTENEWKEFLRSISTLCESSTGNIYRYNLANIEAQLNEVVRGREYFLHNYLKTFLQSYIRRYIPNKLWLYF
ncbi:hypothetical protein HanRHA438_Chr17g0823921 [Helianthus annuus]|nr:hypothetical protein HanRHA438_Chr17g0823921 [Helianthus annuus]